MRIGYVQQTSILCWIAVVIMKNRQILRCFTLSLISLFAVLCCAIPSFGMSGLREKGNPIAPPLTDSPRSTIVGFIDDMNLAYDLVMEVYKQGRRDPGFRYSPPLRRRKEAAEEAIQRAIKTLDLSETALDRRQSVGIESVLRLKEILDRLYLPDFGTIPDLASVTSSNIDRWTIPYSEITLQKIQTGADQGEFLFSADTVKQLKDFYSKIINSPYKPNSSIGFYKFYISKPGSIVPPKWSHWLPNWSNHLIWDQTLWQWFFALLIWFIVSGLIYFVRNYSIYLFSQLSRPKHAWLELSFPAFVWVCVSISKYLIDQVINFTGVPLTLVTMVHACLSLMSSTWLAFLFFNAIGSTFAGSLQSRGFRLESVMTRNGFRFFGIIAGSVILTWGFTQLGFSVAPLLASLGAGSLALSFGLRTYIQDIVGGITIFADQSIKIGDLCEFGSIKGFVEDVSFRSTTLRTLDRDLVVIANSKISALIVNYSRRDKYKFEHKFTLPLETDRQAIEDLVTAIFQNLSKYKLLENVTITVDGLELPFLQIKVKADVQTTEASEYSKIVTQIFLDIADLIKPLVRDSVLYSHEHSR